MLTQLLNWSARVAVRLMGLAVPQWVAAHCEPATRMPKKKTRPCEWITAPHPFGPGTPARCLSQYHQQLC